LPHPFAPLIAIAQRGIPFTPSGGQAVVRLPAPDAVVAFPRPPRPIPTLSGSGIELNFRRLHKATRVIELRTIRETHLAKKALQMRLPISNHRHNPLKKSGLQRHE
jgi:hypothetical protein